MEAAKPNAALIAACEEFVREELAGYDASHDMTHIERVRNTSLRLAREEGLDAAALLVVELAALLHDVGDAKYSGSETAGPERAGGFLRKQGVGEASVRSILYIMEHVSFRKELKTREAEAAAATPTGTAPVPTEGEGGAGSAAEAGGAWEAPLRELAVVQDADRLDAIGAIGIARTFTFGGAKKRPLWVQDAEETTTAEAYAKRSDRGGGTLNHFDDKLFKLKDMMKTEAGRRTAAARHEVMVAYVDQFKREWAGEA